MKATAGVLMAFLLISAGASADAVNKRGAYMGGALGVTDLDDDGAFDGLDFDNSDAGVQIWGGYRFLRWFAVEGEVAYLGNFTVSADGFESANAEAYALTANAVFILPFGQSSWDIYGQLGLGGLAYSIDGPDGSDDGSQGVGTAGVGVRWTPTPTMTLSLGVDAYAWQEDGYYETYDPSITISKLGLQYNF